MANFSLIPVIDLKGGVVVHARQGHRSAYGPVRSRLCPGADPAAIVDALLRLHPFPVLYVADLDAISGSGDHRAQLHELRARFPALALWVDSGIADAAALDRWIAQNIGRVVLGTESIGEAAFVETARRRCGALEPVLSLDFTGDRFQGPPELLADPGRYWPSRVLAMNVRRVGSGTGPDLHLVVGLAGRKAGQCDVFAAGGVRGAADLRELRAAGAAGALVATALHDGRLDGRDIESFALGSAPSGNGEPAP
jgi:phosphoribosylformimino-5-aminoimidazole carboxamide ribotide isomerase